MQEYYKYTNYWKDLGGKKRLDFIMCLLHRVGQELTVIDVGCGTGQITTPLGTLPHIITGIDIHKQSIRLAQENCPFANVNFQVQDIAHITNTYDVVLSCQVLEHLEQPGDMLAHFSRILKPGGTLVITIPNGWWTSELMGRLISTMKKTFGIRRRIRSTNQGMLTANEDNPHIQFFTLTRFKRMLKKEGLRLRRVHSHLFLLNTFPFSLAFFYLPRKIARGLEKVDSALADLLPPFMSSGWYLVIEK